MPILTEIPQAQRERRHWRLWSAGVLLVVLALSAALGSFAYQLHLRTTLVNAVWDGDLPAVSKLLARGVDPNMREQSVGCPVIVMAADRGHYEIVEALFEKGADVNASTTEGGDTALTQSAFQGNTQVIRLLLDRGAQVDAHNTFAATPLWNAAWQGHAGCVQLLLEHGADAHGKTRLGSALHMALLGLKLSSRRGERRRVVLLLKQHGAQE